MDTKRCRRSQRKKHVDPLTLEPIPRKLIFHLNSGTGRSKDNIGVNALSVYEWIRESAFSGSTDLVNPYTRVQFKMSDALMLDRILQEGGINTKWSVTTILSALSKQQKASKLTQPEKHFIAERTKELERRNAVASIEAAIESTASYIINTVDSLANKNSLIVYHSLNALIVQLKCGLVGLMQRDYKAWTHLYSHLHKMFEHRAQTETLYAIYYEYVLHHAFRFTEQQC